MSIKDLLFGKKKTFNHPKIGAFKSDRIKGNNSTKAYTWLGETSIGNNTTKTIIFLEGNNKSPYSKHLDFISELMENWEREYLPNIESEIIKNGIDKVEPFSNWKNDLYLAAIYSTNKKSSDFELNLESIDDEKSDTIGIDVKNGIISKVEIYD